jgi:hypothetical protein
MAYRPGRYGTEGREFESLRARRKASQIQPFFEVAIACLGSSIADLRYAASACGDGTPV